MKVLVTGGNGFIGSFLVEKLMQKGIKVKCLVRKTSDLTWLKNLPIEYVYADLCDPASLEQVVADAETVYHLAGITKARNREGYMQGNYQATQNLLAACNRSGPIDQKFIFVSSLAAAGFSQLERPRTEEDISQPISMYGESKKLAEEAVLAYAETHPAVIIRPPVVYGPRDRDVFVYFKSVQKGFLFILGQGTQKVSLVYVDDLVQGILLAGENNSALGKIFFISGDGEYNWKTIGRTIAVALGKNPITVKVPLWIATSVAAVSVAIANLQKKPALLNWDKTAEMKQPAWLCSNESAKQELRFHPQVDFETGIKLTAEWYRQMQWL